MSDHYWLDCQCGHERNGHFDEVRFCSECPCTRYVAPVQSLLDLSAGAQ